MRGARWHGDSCPRTVEPAAAETTDSPRAPRLPERKALRCSARALLTTEEAERSSARARSSSAPASWSGITAEIFVTVPPIGCSASDSARVTKVSLDTALDGAAFSPESYKRNLPTLDGHKASDLSLRFTGNAKLDATSSGDVAILQAARLGREIRLIVTGTVSSKSFALDTSGEELAYSFAVRVQSVEAGGAGLTTAPTAVRPMSAAEVLEENGFSGDRLLKLCRRIANDELRRRGVVLDHERLEDLVAFLALAGVRAVVRYDPTRHHASYGKNGGEPFASWLADVLAHRVTDWYRSKAEGHGDRRYGNDGRIVLTGDDFNDESNIGVDIERFLSDDRVTEWREAATWSACHSLSSS